MANRMERINHQLRKEISVIIQKEIKDPRIGFVTVIDVKTSPDLKTAKVYYSCLGTEADKQSALLGLKSACGYIRKLLGQRIKIRYTPQLDFRYDEMIEYSQHISDVLEKIKKEDPTLTPPSSGQACGK